MQRDRAKTGRALSALIGICTRVAKGESSERDNRDPSWIMVSSADYSTVSVYVSLRTQARFLVQLIMVGVQTVARAFTQTLRQEYQGMEQQETHLSPAHSDLLVLKHHLFLLYTCAKRFSLSHVATVAARRAAEAAGRDGNKAAQAVSSTGITLQEAQQILNLKDIDDVENIRKVCVCACV